MSDDKQAAIDIVKELATSPEGRLRHWVAKLLKWPINDPRFVDFTPAMWQWYMHQYEQDEKEEFENTRDFIEYLASFWNSEAVTKIKQQRARDKDDKLSTKTTSLGATMKKFFGKDFDESILSKDGSIRSTDTNVGDVKVVKHNNKDGSK